MPRKLGESHAMEERKNFIHDTVIANGEISRPEVMEKFGVTNTTVTMDFKLALIRWPGLMRYDRSSKRYLLADKTLAPPLTITKPTEEPDTFFCQVGLKSGGFDSRIEFRLDGDERAMKNFIESWLALMASAIKLGSST